MNPLSKLTAAYGRFRHTRGHGIHSPFAYNLLKGVIRPGRNYEYYGYFDIDASLSGSHDATKRLLEVRSDARLLLRLSAWLCPKMVYVDPGLPQLLADVPRIADSRCRVVSRPELIPGCSMAVMRAGTLPADSLRRDIDRGMMLMMFDFPDSETDALFHYLSEGLMLRGRHISLLIPRPQMAKISYSVSL